jgi:hypothetical protein
LNDESLETFPLPTWLSSRLVNRPTRLYLSGPTASALQQRYLLLSIGDLLLYSADELRQLPGISRRRLDEITTALAEELQLRLPTQAELEASRYRHWNQLFYWRERSEQRYTSARVAFASLPSMRMDHLCRRLGHDQLGAELDAWGVYWVGDLSGLSRSKLPRKLAGHIDHFLHRSHLDWRLPKLAP